MKRKTVFITGAFVLPILLFFMWCFMESDTYFSDSDSPEVHSQYFNIYNTITADHNIDDGSIMETELSFTGKDNEHPDSKNIEVLATFKRGNSLKPFSIMASHYFFKIQNSQISDSELTLSLKFKLDSSGAVTDKTILIPHLKKVHTWRWKPILH